MRYCYETIEKDYIRSAYSINAACFSAYISVYRTTEDYINGYDRVYLTAVGAAE